MYMGCFGVSGAIGVCWEQGRATGGNGGAGWPASGRRQRPLLGIGRE